MSAAQLQTQRESGPKDPKRQRRDDTERHGMR
jgi:hypothetical protein